MNQQRRHHLLKRVEKLLRQAEGTTFSSEAETALALAQKVLLEHGLTMAEVDALTVEEQQNLLKDESIDDMGSNIIDWKWQLADVIANNFRVSLYFTTEESLVRRVAPHRGWTKKRARSLRFIGLTDDVVIAREVYICARDVADRLSRLYMQDKYVLSEHLSLKFGSPFLDEYSAAVKAVASREIRIAWIGGFISGLREKFRKQVVENPGMAMMLVIHPIVKSAVADLKLKSTVYRSRAPYGANNEAHRAGFEAGREFEHCPTKKLGEVTLRLPVEH